MQCPHCKTEFNDGLLWGYGVRYINKPYKKKAPKIKTLDKQEHRNIKSSETRKKKNLRETGSWLARIYLHETEETKHKTGIDFKIIDTVPSEYTLYLRPGITDAQILHTVIASGCLPRSVSIRNYIVERDYVYSIVNITLKNGFPVCEIRPELKALS